MTGGFEHVNKTMLDVERQQNSLRAAVDSGELWMEAGVAERAAARCQQAVDDIDKWLMGAHRLTQLRKFGDNRDGQAAALRFAQAGQEFVDSMKHARRVFENMAETYRAAGRTVTETEAANEQVFRGRSQ